MQLQHLACIAFWLMIVGLPCVMFVRHQATWSNKWAALCRWMLLPIIAIPLAGLLGFAMSGTVGLIGMSLLFGMSSTALVFVLATASLK